MINKALLEMQGMFEDFGTNIKSAGLPEPDSTSLPPRLPRELQEEMDRCAEADDLTPEDKINQMNKGQRNVFEEIIKSVNNEEGRLFAIDAPGGTGKTFLLSTLLETVRKNGKIAIATAYTNNY